MLLWLALSGLANNLAAIVSFGIFVGSVGFDAAQSQNRGKNIFGEPVLAFLAFEALHDGSDFLAGDRLAQGYKQVGCPKISIVFDDFVFQDQVVPERVPGQLGNQPVVLVEVIAIMRQDEIRDVLSFEFLEEILYVSPYIWEIAVSEFLDHDLFFPRIRQEQVCALECFCPSLPGCRDHDPNYFRSRVIIEESQNRAAAADFDVVAVGSEAQDPEDRITVFWEL